VSGGLKQGRVYGLDAGDALEDLDACDEETFLARKMSPPLALTTVHGHYLMKVDKEKEGSKLPPTLPLSFRTLSAGQMQDLVRIFRPSILFSLQTGEKHDIAGEYLNLKRSLRNNAALRTVLTAQAAKHASANGFDKCWDPLRDDFPTLLPFVCGLASVFPGSSTVESDFSIGMFNESDNRSSPADLTIEGKFHARQWTEVERLPKLAESKHFIRGSETQGEVKNDK
jgi:hypothetical protein